MARFLWHPAWGPFLGVEVIQFDLVTCMGIETMLSN